MAYNVLCGDAFTRLKEFPDNHFDSCILDGPYGLHFMGKSWDKFGGPLGKDHQTTRERSGSMKAGEYNLSLYSNQSFQIWFQQLATEILRVLKPGAYFLSFGAPVPITV